MGKLIVGEVGRIVVYLLEPWKFSFAEDFCRRSEMGCTDNRVKSFVFKKGRTGPEIALKHSKFLPKGDTPMLKGRTVSAQARVRCGLVVLVLSMFAGVARADITGDTVVIQYLYPTSSTLYGLSSTGVVTGSGVSLNLFSEAQVTVFGTNVQMVDIGTGEVSFTAAPFNGVSIQ